MFRLNCLKANAEFTTVRELSDSFGNDLAHTPPGKSAKGDLPRMREREPFSRGTIQPEPIVREGGAFWEREKWESDKAGLPGTPPNPP